MEMRQVIIKHDRNALARNEGRVVAEILKATGFRVEKEIFRGRYYHKGRTLTGSILYKGIYKGMPAVLKVQGLRLAESEDKIIRTFESQNKSKIVHAPKQYLVREWEKGREYGFSIIEYVDAPTICSRPFATPEQMKDFARFYQEYRTKAVTKPWIEPSSSVYVSEREKREDALSSVIGKVDEWRKNAEKEGRLSSEDYAPYLLRFYPLAAKYVPGMDVKFMHRELTAQHIFKLRDGSYRIFSNLLWGYRLEWADLSYVIWRSILDIAGKECSFDRLLRYVQAWLRVYDTIPATRKDKDFDKKIRFLILERTIGIIMGDMGFGEYWGSKEGKRYFKHMLRLNQRLFDHFASELEG